MKVKSTKSALLMSFTSLLLCFAMLIGCTFAWFTDSVTSGVNRIVAGNLDVDVEYAKLKADGTIDSWLSLTDANSLFSSNLWEPGHTEYVTLKVVNKGTLALKYKMNVSPISESGGINMAGNSFKLSDYLVFATTAPNKDLTTYADRAAARADAAGTEMKLKQGELSKESTLYPKDSSAGASEQYITLVVYMPEEVGNEANYKTGTKAPEIDLGITVVATQKDHENDSFNNEYDKFADLTPDNVGKDALVYDYFPQVVVTGQLEIKNDGEVAKGTAAGSETNVTKNEDGSSTVELDSPEKVEDNTAAKLTVTVKKDENSAKDTGSLTLKVVKDDAENAAFQTKYESSTGETAEDTPSIDTTKQDSTTYQVTVECEGVVPQPPAEDKALYKVDLFIGFYRTGVEMYHTHKDESTQVITTTKMLTTGDTGYAEGADNTFTYNSATGYVTMYVDVFSPFTAVYDAPVASVGTSLFYSLREAVETAMVTLKPVIMLKDTTVVGNVGIEIPANKEVTIDLSGWTITGQFDEAKDGVVFKNNGKLTIKDSSANQTGKITDTGLTVDEAGNWHTDPKRNYADNVISNYGTLTLESGTIEQGINGNIVYCVDNYSGATFNMTGGHLYNWSTAAVRMFCNSTTQDNTVNISGGLIEGYQGVWVQNPSGTKSVGGIKDKGTLNISGGTFNVLGSGTDAIYSYEAYYGDRPDGYGNYYDCSKININITGGTFNSKINIYKCAGDPSKNVNLAISGGSFIAKTQKTSNDSYISLGGGYYYYKPSSDRWVYYYFGDDTYEAGWYYYSGDFVAYCAAIGYAVSADQDYMYVTPSKVDGMIAGATANLENGYLVVSVGD